jgi:hypothetical protein
MTFEQLNEIYYKYFMTNGLYIDERAKSRSYPLNRFLYFKHRINHSILNCIHEPKSLVDISNENEISSRLKSRLVSNPVSSRLASNLVARDETTFSIFYEARRDETETPKIKNFHD